MILYGSIAEYAWNIKLKLTVEKTDWAWRSFLDSEGYIWACFDEGTQASSKMVVVLSSDADIHLKDFARMVLEHGGTIIVEPGTGFSVTDNTTDQRVKYPYHCSTFSLLKDITDPSAVSVSIQRHESGAIIYLPFSLKPLWHDRRISKKYLVIEDAEKLMVWENLPHVSRKNMRKVLVDVLWRAFDAAGIPLVKKWYWPRGAQSFFCLRADMDAGNEASMRSFLNTVHPWASKLSLFVCGQAYRGKEKLLQDVANLGSEIGNHTFTHYVYSNVEQNRANIELTEKLLEQVGTRTRGYVGPASFWHPSMYQVLQEKGYEYTSSFGFDHDTLPYYPSRPDGEEYEMLEIPFHCLGDRFPRFGLELDSPTIIRFFDELIERKYHSSEPVNIYGHPDMVGRLGDSPNLIESICNKALSFRNVASGNMSELTVWWRKRHASHASIKYDMTTNNIIAESMQSDPDVYWSIKVAENGLFLVSGEELRKGISLDQLEQLPKMKMQNPTRNLTGEVMDPHFAKVGLKKLVSDWRRNFRRKRLKIDELNYACKQAGWRGED